MHYFGILAWMIVLGCAAYHGVFFLTNAASKARFRELLAGFEQKMWMTAGLGFIFFGLYVLLVWLSSLYLHDDLKKQIIALMMENPQFFIYTGLTIFVIISISIYIARMFIKYLYNTK